MTIEFYINNSENIKIDKDIALQFTMTGTLKQSTSILNPVIIIKVDNSLLTSFINSNYIHISEFNRYYYINDIININNDMWQIKCSVDVLKTYASEIKSQQAIIKRQENNWNLYLNDGSFRVYQNRQVVTKPFPSGFNTWEFVLSVAGK